MVHALFLSAIRIVIDCLPRNRVSRPFICFQYVSLLTAYLRHTFTTRLIESDMNVKVIQEALGHSDIQTTLNIYADVTKELKKQQFAQFDDFITANDSVHQ